MRARELAVFLGCSLAGAIVVAPSIGKSAWYTRVPGSACAAYYSVCGLSGFDGWGGFTFTSGCSGSLTCPFTWNTTNPDKSVTAANVDAYQVTAGSGQVCIEACYQLNDRSGFGCSTSACGGSTAGHVSVSPSITNWSGDILGYAYDTAYVSVAVPSGGTVHVMGVTVTE